MKKFEVPMMMMVRLPQNDVIATSPTCDSKICFGYVCPDCPTICTGAYECDIFKCTTYTE